MVKEKEVTLEPPSKNSALDKIKESIIKFINNPIQQKSSGLESKPTLPALQPPQSPPEVMNFIDIPLFNFKKTEFISFLFIFKVRSGDSKIPHLNELLLSIILQRGSGALRDILPSDMQIPDELLTRVKDKIPISDIKLYTALAHQGLFALNEDTLLDLHYFININHYDKASSSKQNQAPHLGSATPVAFNPVTLEEKQGEEGGCADCDVIKNQDRGHIPRENFPPLSPVPSRHESREGSEQRTTLEKLRFPDEL